MRIKQFLLTRTARAASLVAAAAILLGLAPAAIAAGPGAGNNNIKIFEYFGAGNLARSEYAQDTIILFNPTQVPITMNNWSIQVGASGTPTIYKLPVVTIPAGGYFSIAGSSPSYISGVGCVSTVCTPSVPFDYRLRTIENTTCDGAGIPAGRVPACTAADNILSSTQTTVLLVSNQTAVTFGTNSYCPTSTNVVDLLSVGNPTASSVGTAGSVPTCYEGTSYAPYQVSDTNRNISYELATVRKSKCVDTDDNAADFTLAAITYYNSSTTPQPCPLGPTQLQVTGGGISPSTPGVTDTVLITGTVSKATPASNTTMVAYLFDLGVNTPIQLYDDGTHGDAVAGDGTYSGLGTIGQVPVKTQPFAVTLVATDATGSYATQSFPVLIRTGYLTMTSPASAYTIAAGDVLNIPVTVRGNGGYSGFVSFSCLGLVAGTKIQCVATPPFATLSVNGSQTVNLAIAAGTTHSASMLARTLPLSLFGVLGMMLLGVAVWRRKHLPAASLLALAVFLSLHATGCETNAGLGNTATTAGIYNVILEGIDSNTNRVVDLDTGAVSYVTIPVGGTPIYVDLPIAVTVK